MPSDFPTEDDINKMYQQHLKDEVARNKESIEQQKADFKRQLEEARTGQRQHTQELPGSAPANDNKQAEASLNNTHNTGQGKEKATSRAEEKEKFKQQLQEARQGQQRTTELQANKEDISSEQAKKTADYKANGKSITEKKPEPNEGVSQASPKPTPSPNFTRTWGPDRD